ncbi:MAG: hypothetical protein LIP01_07960 [Tannerellaceae bacterium]|nr:hypothetical protein [Tannerellaceae bacterium]
MIKQTYLFICILIGMGLTACQDFDDTRNSSSETDGKTVEVTITTTVPALTLQTKADVEPTKTEKQLEHVDILVFKVDGENETFAYRTHHTNDLSSLDYDNEIAIKARLQVSENNEKYRIVLIANLKTELDNFFESNYTDTPAIEDLLKELTFEQTQK